MNFFKKITGSFLLMAIVSLMFVPSAFAQSALDDIKARLESEGVAVIDYSTPKGAWGSLPAKWSNYLRDKYENLEEIANELSGDFIGENSLTALRRQLAKAEAEKSALTIAADLQVKNNEIASLEEDIEDLEGEIKDDIRSRISDAPGKGLNIEEGINLIFHEVDFYFNYSKWGRLPVRIIALLEGEGYESLQDMVDLWGAAEFNPYDFQTSVSQIEGISDDDAALIVDSVAILQASGESQLNLIARAIANTMKNVVIGIAILWIIYAGIRMVFAQGDENVITEQKRSIIYAGIGLISILLVDRGIDYLYGPAGITRTELVKDQGFTNEVYGLVNFIKALIGTIAILFIVISGVRILFAGGEEDTINKQKKSLLWAAVGLILIAIDKILIEQIFIVPSQEQSDQIRTSNITTIINTVGSVFQFILGFVGLVAFGILIYGAATMVMNYGNDEMVQNSKKIIQNAIIGIVVILSSYAIVSTLVIFR